MTKRTPSESTEQTLVHLMRHFGERDEATQWDAFTELHFPLKEDGWRAWYLTLGLHSGLGDDGWRDRLTPRLAIRRFWN